MSRTKTRGSRWRSWFTFTGSRGDDNARAVPVPRRYDEYGVVSCTQGYLLHGKTSLYLRREPPPLRGRLFWHGLQDLQESRRILVIIRLITPLSLTSNEARSPSLEHGVRKRRVPGNPTPLPDVAIADGLFQVGFAIFACRLIPRRAGENAAERGQVAGTSWTLAHWIRHWCCHFSREIALSEKFPALWSSVLYSKLFGWYFASLAT